MRRLLLKFLAILLACSLGVTVYLIAQNISESNGRVEQEATALMQEHEEHVNVNIEATQPSQVPPAQQGAVIHVCLCADEDTMLGAMATVNSIWSNTRRRIFFHVVTNKLAYEHFKQWFEGTELRATEYELIVFDETLVKDKIVVRDTRQELASPMNFARFFYPDLMPHLHGKVIHIDDDCIVQGDITELYDTTLEESDIVAVSNDCDSPYKRHIGFPPIYSNYINFNHDAIKALRMRGTTCSFNTGVYVFEADRWRHHNVTLQLLHWMQLNVQEEVYGAEKGGGASQQPMMIVLYNKISYITDPLWHVRYLGSSTSKHFSPAFIKNAKLLHWNGKFKPWKGVSAYKELWDKYAVLDPLGEHQAVRKKRT